MAQDIPSSSSSSLSLVDGLGASLDPPSGVTSGVGNQGTFACQVEQNDPPSEEPSPSTSRKTSSSTLQLPAQLGGHPSPAQNAIGRGMACTFCRKRKLRCSGDRPTCTSCIKYNKACEYAATVVQHARLTNEPIEPPVETPVFSSEPLSHPFTSQSLDNSRRPSASTPLFDPNGPPPSSSNNVPSASYMPTEWQGQGFVDESAWWQATMNHGGQPRSHQQHGWSYPTYDDPTYQSHVLPSQQPPPPTHLVEQTYTTDGVDLLAQPGSLPVQYVPPDGYYTVPAIEGYQPGIVHEGVYLPASSTANNPSGQAQTPMPVYNSSVHQTNAYGIDPLYTSEESRLYAQEPLVHSIPPLQQQTSPHPIHPIPRGDFDTRPSHPRAMSAPTRKMSMIMSTASGTPETSSTPRSETTVNVSVPETEKFTANMNVMYSAMPVDPVDRLTDRLGEFLLGPNDSPSSSPVTGPTGLTGESGRKRKERGDPTPTQPQQATLVPGRFESDGLSESSRNALLEVFFQHHKIFLDLSVPRFKYRLAHNDSRRPGLALLNAMYMWATRMSHAPNMASMEQHFYEAAIRHLDASASTGDRLMDCIRAAFLLSAFQYMNGRHHSGYLLCGHAARIVKSCGLHKIKSTVFSPSPRTNPLLRHRPYLLPPPEDALELGERVHTFWAVFSLDRSSSALTGFSSEFVDEEVTTPWPRDLSDIASCSVTLRDDVTVRDLYRSTSYQHPAERSYLRWVKAITILERASKLVFLDPEESSEHTRAHRSYAQNSHPLGRPPPGYLEQPKYRVPTAYAETKLALDLLLKSCGAEGLFPVDRKNGVTGGEMVISPAIIIFHHICAAIETLLHDTNSLDCENADALVGARKSVALIRELPTIPVHAVDSFAPLVWVMIAKVLIKEMHRLRLIGDTNHAMVELDAKCLIAEIDRVGSMQPTCRMYARGVEELMKVDQGPSRTRSYEHP